MMIIRIALRIYGANDDALPGIVRIQKIGFSNFNKNTIFAARNSWTDL